MIRALRQLFCIYGSCLRVARARRAPAGRKWSFLNFGFRARGWVQKFYFYTKTSKIKLSSKLLEQIFDLVFVGLWNETFIFFWDGFQQKRCRPPGGVFFAGPGARRAPTVFLKMPEVGKQFCENIALGVPGLRQTLTVLALDVFRSSTQKVCQNSSPVIFYRTFNFTGWQNEKEL